MKIGVFDSGVGGLSVVNAIKKALPEIEILYVEDKVNLPYGTKTSEELFRLTLPLLNKLSNEGCQIIVIACNTVTTTIIEELRSSLSVPLVGMEPMIKPAAEISKNKTIAVCATPTTLSSKRYEWLKETYAKECSVLEPDCSDWAYMIENDRLDRNKIQQRITEVCEAGADTIVLGCTHYHWIEEDIQKIADEYGALVLQPEQPVIEQLKRTIPTLAD